MVEIKFRLIFIIKFGEELMQLCRVETKRVRHEVSKLSDQVIHLEVQGSESADFNT